MSFWPSEIKLKEILVNSLWSFIAWFLWSIVIILLTFFSSRLIEMPTNITEVASNWVKISAMFPILLSVITFIWTSITVFLTYYMFNLTAPERYKRNRTILWQISFYWIFLYLCIVPIYFYVWMTSYSSIINVFLIHTIILTFWTSIILEILNNYRYVLLWIYWSFIWLFFSSLFTIIILVSFSTWWYARLILLISLLPIINFTITFFKQVFELLYYRYNKYTNLDPLWDIFYQIEIEEKERARQL